MLLHTLLLAHVQNISLFNIIVFVIIIGDTVLSFKPFGEYL